MPKQLRLFDENHGVGPSSFSVAPPAKEKYEGALLFSAIGDALGWPTEFLSGNRRPSSFDLPVRDYVQWEKLVGGKWWGYRDVIERGQYSDDTQLTLAIARSIASDGDFVAEKFAYEELPLWLHYERGGGKSIKTAARALIKRNGSWLRNYYSNKEINYFNAGANGAAMRNLPLALAYVNDVDRLIIDSFINSIITHGHPRAIVGAIVYGLGVRHLLLTSDTSTLIESILEELGRIDRVIWSDERIVQWIRRWKAPKSVGIEAASRDFDNVFGTTLVEMRELLLKASGFRDQGRSSREYYSEVGALNSETKGSGTATVSAAIYTVLKQAGTPAEQVLEAVNMLGSDTDTIASFVGGLLGAAYGVEAIPSQLAAHVQDQEYLLKIARRIHGMLEDKRNGQEEDRVLEVHSKVDRDQSYLKILAWEIGLNEMFWDALDESDRVIHPTLGGGRITKKLIQSIPNRPDYIAKLIHISFESGQSCVFHSRVKNGDEVQNSLAPELEKALKIE